MHGPRRGAQWPPRPATMQGVGLHASTAMHAHVRGFAQVPFWPIGFWPFRARLISPVLPDV